MLIKDPSNLITQKIGEMTDIRKDVGTWKIAGLEIRKMKCNASNNSNTCRTFDTLGMTIKNASIFARNINQITVINEHNCLYILVESTIKILCFYKTGYRL